MKQKHYYNSLCARLMTLLVLALLSTSYAWGAEDSATSATMTASTTYQDLQSGKLIEYKNSAANSYSNPVRIYSGNTFTIHAKEGVTKITKIEIEANSSSYASSTLNSTWSASGTGSCGAKSAIDQENTQIIIVTLSGTVTTVTCKTSAQVRWNKLTVYYEVAGSGKTLNSIAVSGTPTRTTYEAGEEFDPTGLTVTGTYDDKSTATITSGIEWTVTPSPLTVGTTSVSVVAKVGTISSTPYTVNGLTVSAKLPSVSWDATEQEYENGESVTSVNLLEDAIQIAFEGGVYYNTGTAVRVYGGKTLTISSETLKITKVEFTFGTGDNSNAITSNVGTYSNGIWSGKASTVIFTVGGSSGHRRFKALKVYYEEAAPSVATPVITPSSTADVYWDSIKVGLTCETVGAKIYYTADGTEPSTASELYEDSITISATTTIKAIAVKDGLSDSEVASKTFNFGSIFNSLEALVAADITSGTTVKVSFENIPIKSIYTTKEGYRNGIYFDIQKDGKDIEIYYKNVPNEWVVGGTVSGTMTCPWKEYNGTWELAPESESWDWTNLTYNEPTKELPTITATYKTNLNVGEEDEYEVTYDGDGELSITSSNENIAEAIIVDGTVLIEAKAAGATTITISAPETDNYYAASKVYTLTVVGPASLPFAFNGGVKDIANTAGMSQTGLGSDYGSSPKLKFDTTGDNVVIWFDGQAGAISYDIKGNSFNGGTFDVMESADGKEYTSVASDTAVVGTLTTKTNKLLSTTRYVKFIYTEKSSGNVALGNINIVRGSTNTISTTGFSTGFAPFDAKVEGATAYQVTVNGNVATLVEIENVIPANTGVILHGTAEATATFTETVGGTKENVEGNKLVAATEIFTCTAEDYGKVFYLGKNDNGNAAFRMLIEGGTIAGGKAYLMLDSALAEGAKLEVVFADVPTGIEVINDAKPMEGVIYNIQGMRTNNMVKGNIYIVNGKKYLVK